MESHGIQTDGKVYQVTILITGMIIDLLMEELHHVTRCCWKRPFCLSFTCC